MKFEDQKSWVRVGALYEKGEGMTIYIYDDIRKGTKVFAFKNEDQRGPTSPDYNLYVKSLYDGVLK